MKKYEKPAVFVLDELAEGIYTASGSSDANTSEGGSGVAVGSVKEKTAGNEWNKVNTYAVTVKNNGSKESADWSVDVHVKEGTADSVQIYNTWQASASLKGNTITITPGDGGNVPAGGSIEIELVVKYSGNSVSVGK